MIILGYYQQKLFSLQLIDYEMSLTYRMKSRGPRIEPWGTPEITGCHEENKSFKDTLCLHVVKKRLNHTNKAPPTPYNCSFNNNLSCGTESTYPRTNNV